MRNGINTCFKNFGVVEKLNRFLFNILSDQKMTVISSYKTLALGRIDMSQFHQKGQNNFKNRACRDASRAETTTLLVDIIIHINKPAAKKWKKQQPWYRAAAKERKDAPHSARLGYKYATRTASAAIKNDESGERATWPRAQTLKTRDFFSCTNVIYVSTCARPWTRNDARCESVPEARESISHRRFLTLVGGDACITTMRKSRLLFVFFGLLQSALVGFERKKCGRKGCNSAV